MLIATRSRAERKVTRKQRERIGRNSGGILVSSTMVVEVSVVTSITGDFLSASLILLIVVSSTIIASSFMFPSSSESCTRFDMVRSKSTFTSSSNSCFAYILVLAFL